MLRRLFPSMSLAFACALAALLSLPSVAAASTCEATARRESRDARLQRAVDEARRQHQLFGSQTIERNGGMFQVGWHEAEWGRPEGESTATWQRVATYWRALSEADPPALTTSLGPVARADATAARNGNGDPSATEVAVREALLRASIVDTPWSAAFISYLFKAAGFAREEFAFSHRHADYVRAALEATTLEAGGHKAAHAYRACDAATTRPRPGDVLCATRASTAGTVDFAALATAMAARSDVGFPMHCDIVVRSDQGGDAKLEVVGGNVLNSVTLSRMTLNARKVLSDAYITGAGPSAGCAGRQPPCREHLSRRPWLVVLQFRH